MFVVEYFEKYKKQYDNWNLNIICSFFKGLNLALFEETYKEIKMFYSNEYYAEIVKYIETFLKMIIKQKMEKKILIK